MIRPARAPRLFLALGFAAILAGGALAQQPAGEPFKPYPGQPGRDVVWVPTPDSTVQKMLDVAKAVPSDYVIDLGSGDGRMVIAAAKRGIAGHGVEYNEKMVELATKLAREAGVSDKARFIQGDMYEADISKATLLPLFLLTENLNVLRPKFLQLRPGVRIVSNGFRIDDWDHDEFHRAGGDCGQWCSVYLYIVPAQVAGEWMIGEAKLSLKQDVQKITGTLAGLPITDGKLNGAAISFSAGGVQYTGRVEGGEMRGEAKGGQAGSWSARRM